MKNKNLTEEQKKEIFVCDLCGSVEQVRTGYYPYYHDVLVFDTDDPMISFMDLCSGCAPKTLKDGSPSGYKGVWHNKFPRRSWKQWKFIKVINRKEEDKIDL